MIYHKSSYYRGKINIWHNPNAQKKDLENLVGIINTTVLSSLDVAKNKNQSINYAEVIVAPYVTIITVQYTNPNHTEILHPEMPFNPKVFYLKENQMLQLHYITKPHNKTDNYGNNH